MDRALGPVMHPDDGGAVRTNYIDEVANELAVLLPDCSRPLLRIYALLALVLGAGVTEEDVHDAWSVWLLVVEGKTTHRSLKPFEALEPSVQRLDAPYAEAIRKVAERIGT